MGKKPPAIADGRETPTATAARAYLSVSRYSFFSTGIKDRRVKRVNEGKSVMKWKRSRRPSLTSSIILYKPLNVRRHVPPLHTLLHPAFIARCSSPTAWASPRCGRSAKCPFPAARTNGCARPSAYSCALIAGPQATEALTAGVGGVSFL